MSAEQNITPAAPAATTKPEPSFSERLAQRWSALTQWGRLVGMTGIALAFIINGVAVGLYCFNLVHPPKMAAAVFGSISVAFATYVLGMLVNSGVKFQMSSNKKRR